MSEQQPEKKRPGRPRGSARPANKKAGDKYILKFGMPSIRSGGMTPRRGGEFS